MFTLQNPSNHPLIHHVSRRRLIHLMSTPVLNCTRFVNAEQDNKRIFHDFQKESFALLVKYILEGHIIWPRFAPTGLIQVIGSTNIKSAAHPSFRGYKSAKHWQNKSFSTLSSHHSCSTGVPCGRGWLSPGLFQQQRNRGHSNRVFYFRKHSSPQETLLEVVVWTNNRSPLTRTLTLWHGTLVMVVTWGLTTAPKQ